MQDDCISRQAVLDAFADYVGSGMSMDDFDALWNIVVKIQPVNLQEPKFIAKSDGTIEQIKNCEDCIFKKEWVKIGKLISVILEKKTEQEPKTGHWMKSRDSYGNYHFVCSECGNDIATQYADVWEDKYCSECGAKMESEG